MTATNRLARETSPYLLQHAHNPVDWYAWGDEAFARARAEDKPILLSVGYSACHWCHVMERESFENHDIAEVMNQHFVNVKVDREERPDVDQIYMQAVQSMTGHGGWPMTVFLTPEGAPFYGGTYFPPTDRHGLPGFPRLLQSIAEAWRTRRDDVLHSSTQIAAELNRGERLRGSATLLTRGGALRRLPGAVGAVRRAARRLRGRAQVPAADELGVHAAVLEAERQPAGAPARRDHADPDGPRRHLRPARRRVPPLLGRRATGWSRTSRRCSTTTASSPRSTCTAGSRSATPSTGGSARRRSTTSCAR